MARLQDFQTVTPTDSDNLLVVQATGQGLATVGSTLGAKMDKANPTGTGSLSLNRKANTTVGSNSVALGLGCTSSANQTFAAGYNNEASGVTACAVNSTNTASGSGAFCSGYGNIAQRQFNHVFGMYNQADTGGTDATTKGNYIEIVGKGTNPNSRSNARTLDWSGNEVLAGDLTIMGNKSLNGMYEGEDYSSHFTATQGAMSTYSVTKYGRIVVVTGTTAKVTTANSYITLGTFASGYRPTKTFTGSFTNATASDLGYGSVSVASDGVLKFIYSKTTTYGLYFSIFIII